MVTQITSAKNPKVKHAYALRERRERDREGVTILEGYRELSRALALGIRIRECFCCPELYLGENENKLIADIEHSGAEIYETTKEILIKLAYRDRPEGLIAIAEMKKKGLESMPVRKDGLYLVAETIEKPGNLGSILRSADAVGATGYFQSERDPRQHRGDFLRAAGGNLLRGSAGMAPQTRNQNARGNTSHGPRLHRKRHDLRHRDCGGRGTIRAFRLLDELPRCAGGHPDARQDGLAECCNCCHAPAL